MKRFLLHIVLCLIPVVGLSQTKKVIYKDTIDSSYQIGYINKFGQKDSCWFFYGNTNNILATANYKNGIKNGEWITYYKNGNIHIKMYYLNGILVSGKRWDENNNLLEER